MRLRTFCEPTIQASGWPIRWKSRSWQFTSRRTILRTSSGRLPDRRRGHGHFGRGRLSHSESVGIMHPFRKLREAGPMTPAQVAVVLNRDVVMHTPLLIKPLVGRELVAIVIAMSTQSRDDPGAYVLEDYPPPMARHGRRTSSRAWSS